MQLGRQNDLGRAHPEEQDESVTLVTIQNGSNNAVFAALNNGGNPPDASPGGVGVFGQSFAGGVDESQPLLTPAPPLTAGIGVAGHCNTGCGVYGQSIYGAGVVGSASTIGWGTWGPKLAPTFQQAGVLGQSDVGPGVRGHGGSFNPPPPSLDPTFTRS